MASPVWPEEPACQAVLAFNQALNARDLEGMLACLTPDSVFENTYPAPEGERYVGRPAVRAFWEAFFQGSRQATLEFEELFGLGDRCVLRWVYRWVDLAGRPGHVRGVDIYTLRDGLIAEKLSYVKG